MAQAVFPACFPLVGLGHSVDHVSLSAHLILLTANQDVRRTWRLRLGALDIVVKQLLRLYCWTN